MPKCFLQSSSGLDRESASGKDWCCLEASDRDSFTFRTQCFLQPWKREQTCLYTQTCRTFLRESRFTLFHYFSAIHKVRAHASYMGVTSHMRRFTTLSILTIFLAPVIATGQSKNEIDSLITLLTSVNDSRELVNQSASERFVELGEDALEPLALTFTDSTLTDVYSECQNRKLKRGELAIIMADRIELMPYYTITGIQNCLLTFCEDNPNLIEYYLTDTERLGVEEFQTRYLAWLNGKERLNWGPRVNKLTKREHRRELRKRKKEN